MIDTYHKHSFIFDCFICRLNLDKWEILLSKQKRDRYTIDLLNDYICIIYGDAFEIKLCLNDLIENTTMVRQYY